MLKFGSPKQPAALKSPSKTRTTRSKKSSIPMTSVPSTTKRETRPQWVKWTILNGRAHRQFMPGFFYETAPSGYAAEGSQEEEEMKASVLKDAR